MESGVSFQKLQEYIEAMPKADRERYRLLIQEAVERDAQISTSYECAMRNAADLSAGLRALTDETARLKERIGKLLKAVLEVRDAAWTISEVYDRGPSWN